MPPNPTLEIECWKCVDEGIVVKYIQAILLVYLATIGLKQEKASAVVRAWLVPVKAAGTSKKKTRQPPTASLVDTITIQDEDDDEMHEMHCPGVATTFTGKAGHMRFKDGVVDCSKLGHVVDPAVDVNALKQEYKDSMTKDQEQWLIHNNRKFDVDAGIYHLTSPPGYNFAHADINLFFNGLFPSSPHMNDFRLLIGYLASGSQKSSSQYNVAGKLLPQKYGSVVLLVGDSNSGKSTTINILKSYLGPYVADFGKGAEVLRRPGPYGHLKEKSKLAGKYCF